MIIIKKNIKKKKFKIQKIFNKQHNMNLLMIFFHN